MHTLTYCGSSKQQQKEKINKKKNNHNKKTKKEINSVDVDLVKTVSVEKIPTLLQKSGSSIIENYVQSKDKDIFNEAELCDSEKELLENVRRARKEEMIAKSPINETVNNFAEDFNENEEKTNETVWYCRNTAGCFYGNFTCR
jgi:hypothetical protein